MAQYGDLLHNTPNSSKGIIWPYNCQTSFVWNATFLATNTRVPKDKWQEYELPLPPANLSCRWWESQKSMPFFLRWTLHSTSRGRYSCPRPISFKDIKEVVRKDWERNSAFLNECLLCRVWWSAFHVGHLICSSSCLFEVGGIIMILKMKTLSLREGKWLPPLSPVGEPGFSFGSGWLPSSYPFHSTLCFQRWTHPRAHYVRSSEILSQVDVIHKSLFWHEMLLFKSLEIWNQPTDQLIN